MNLIGEITKNDEDDLLSFPDFCRLFQLIKKHVEPRLTFQLAQLKDERRKALDDHELQEYRYIVLQMNEIEGEICNEITEKVFEHFNITQECFQESWRMASLPEN